MEADYLSSLISALTKFRRNGTVSDSLMQKYSDLSIFTLKHQDTMYGGMMMEALRIFWEEPTLERTLRRAVEVLFKHYHLEITPFVRKTFLERHKIDS